MNNAATAKDAAATAEHADTGKDDGATAKNATSVRDYVPAAMGPATARGTIMAARASSKALRASAAVSNIPIRSGGEKVIAAAGEKLQPALAAKGKP